jgi:hypothetical protein
VWEDGRSEQTLSPYLPSTSLPILPTQSALTPLITPATQSYSHLYPLTSPSLSTSKSLLTYARPSRPSPTPDSEQGSSSSSKAPSGSKKKSKLRDPVTEAIQLLQMVCEARLMLRPLIKKGGMGGR